MSRKNVIANRYEVISHIGAGGMADVFLAVDTILNRQVAIKILRADMSTDETSIKRFEREAQAAAALAHPNIVEIYDVGEYRSKYHYIVMEYLPGKTLKQTIRARGPLFADEAVDIMKQLTSAVAVAHSRGIIHRDLKPQNIVVKADGSVKILDFGIAIARGASQLTQTNNVMGSVHYLAPELAKGQQASPQSDMYSLGVIFYEMLSGDVPFKAEQAVQVALKHMREPFPSIRALNPSLPQAVENILIRATAKKPELRYANCAEMLNDIATCLSPERADEKPLVLTPAAEPEKPVSEPRKKKAPAAEEKEKASQPAPEVKEKKERKEKKQTKARTINKEKDRHLLHLLAGVIGLIAAAAVIASLVLSGTLSFGTKTYVVPELGGKTLAEAKQACIDAGLTFNGEGVTYTLTDDVEKGKIVFVDPEIGSVVEKGAPVTVTVSSGIGVEMENFIGMNINDAENRINSDPAKYGLLKVNVQEESSDEPAGKIIRQEKLAPGDKFNPEVASQVTLVYSSYPTISIPDSIIGMDINSAVKMLEGMDVVVRTSNRDTTQMSQEAIDGLEVGVVIECSPAAGTAYTQKGSNYITLYFY